LTFPSKSKQTRKEFVRSNEDSQVGVSKNLIGKKRVLPDESKLPSEYENYVNMASSKQ